ncbi:TetR/AcrR family transcriptional regulator [Pseudoroseomonas cervicalis]|uniref:TetR/AcrR family transcriptional regulator n=1 Tax=Teichococcus cervicalis TaxID=204525 RepID=UPI002787F485|nr:TetR/AcrR family transcriptional regulator [Pseudoroseomonas cervicalis]MDQ1077496.1 TetR/AcrR family transcriptional repressor of nem operon [Pseudoroseomonas cervicalis]
MRVSREQAAENRARILEQASRLFRERGLSGVGVDALSEAAGLTHGGLYSRFGSKERLAAAALEAALERGLLHRIGSEGGPEPTLEAVLARYLSPTHRDAPGQGCAMAALGCEVSRQPPPVRHAFTEGLRRKIAPLAALLPGGKGRAREDQARKDQASEDQAREDQALALMAGLVGAMMLARAVDDPALSDRILEASRAEWRRRLAAAEDAA